MREKRNNRILTVSDKKENVEPARRRKEGLRCRRNIRIVQKDPQEKGQQCWVLQTPRIGSFLVAVKRAESDASQKHCKRGFKGREKMDEKAATWHYFLKKFNTLQRNNEQIIQKQVGNIFMRQESQAHL